jgi:phthalate 4,5-dioxygenase oxygenase subunit
MFYWIAWHETEGIDRDAWRAFCGAVPGVDVDPVTFEKKRTRDNNYLQDRAAMKQGDFTGIAGIPNQDMAMWESMGPIADRTHDKLGSSDRAIVEFRKLALAMARDAMEGHASDAVRLRPGDAHSFEGLVRKTDDWRTVASPAQG